LNKKYGLVLSLIALLLVISGFRIIDTPVFTPTYRPPPTRLPTVTLPPPVLPSPTPTLVSIPQAEKIENVIVISIDGLRPDALDLADTPTLDSLRAKGAYCPHAQTVVPNITLPSHASMLSGMTPEKHGIRWGVPYIGWPGMTGPTLFNVAHDAGLSTAMIFGKEKFNYLVLGDSVDTLFGGDVHDPEIKAWAIQVIEAGLPNVLFIHFPDTDRVGHAYGWMSPNQLYAVTYVDGLLGEIMTTLEQEGYLNSTLLLISSDHGGNNRGHEEDTPVNRTIPWLAVGPHVRVGEQPSRLINTYDTAATILHALELPIPENWDGQPVLEIFE
jgi:hypothetical protein